MAVNLCKDCRFYREAREVDPVVGDTFPVLACDRPRDGDMTWSAPTERRFEDLCGKAGRFFEPRASEAA
jgi:hypothetical protein